MSEKAASIKNDVSVNNSSVVESGPAYPQASTSLDQANDILSGFDEKKRQAMRLKADLHVIPPLAILYLLSYMDRGSLANASIFGLKTSLGITTTQYNLAVTVFFFTYATFEIPSTIGLQKVKPSTWVAALTVAWGLVMTLSGLVQNYGGLIASRVFLGVTEAGFFPAAIYLLSNWYSRSELQLRVSILYAVGTFSGAFTGLLAYGIGHMDGVGGQASWRWLYYLEGIFSVLMGILVKFVLTDSPATASWLDEEEKEYFEALKVLRGDGSGSHTFELAQVKKATSDYKVWMATWICVCQNVCLFGFTYTLPTILTALGYTAESAQSMTVPLYAVACVCCLIGSFTSSFYNQRSPVIFVGYSLALIGLVATIVMPKDRLYKLQYFWLFFILSGLYIAYPGVLAWCANNAAGPGKRSIATALQLTIGNLSSAAGTNTYLASQKPHYWLGLGLAIGVIFSGLVMTAALVACLRRENKRKMNDTFLYTVEELEKMGDKAPTFIYSY